MNFKPKTCTKSCVLELLEILYTLMPTLVFIATAIILRLFAKKKKSATAKKLLYGLAIAYLGSWSVLYVHSVIKVHNLEAIPEMAAPNQATVNSLPKKLFVRFSPISKERLELFSPYFEEIYLYNKEEESFFNITTNFKVNEPPKNSLILSSWGGSASACYDCFPPIEYLLFGKPWPKKRTSTTAILKQDDKIILYITSLSAQVGTSYRGYRENTTLRFPPILTLGGWVHNPIQSSNMENIALQKLAEFINQQALNLKPKIITRQHDPLQTH